MSIVQPGLGVDVSARTFQCTLQIGDRTQSLRLPNREGGFVSLLEWLRPRCELCALTVLMEATGNYHIALAESLEQHGVEVAVMNPRQAKELVKGLGFMAKTDRVDARALARVAALALVKGSPLRSQEHRALRDVSRQIHNLTHERTRAKKRAGTPARGQAASASDQRLIAFLNEEIRRLEKEWQQMLQELTILLQRYKLALSVKGVGEATARVLVSELPQHLELYSLKQLAAYAGCAPMDNSSGQRKGHAKPSKTGNRYIRGGTFMAGLLASFRDDDHQARYDRLLQAGRHHFQAVRAVEHSIVRQALAVMKRGTPWCARRVDLT